MTRLLLITLLISALPATAVAEGGADPKAMMEQYRYRASIYVSDWRGPWINEQPPPVRGSGFLVIGSSSVVGQLGRSAESQLKALGFNVLRRGKSASGLTRTDYFDWWKEAKQMKIPRNTVGALVYMGVNDAQGIWLHPHEKRWAKRPSDPWIRWQQPGWSEIYRDRVTSFAETLCKRGIGRVIFLLPVDVAKRFLSRRMTRVRRLQREGVMRSSCGAAVSAAGDRLWLKRFGVRKSEQRRAADGYHLSPYGADIVWKRIRGHILHLVGGLPAAPEVHRLISRSDVRRSRL